MSDRKQEITSLNQWFEENPNLPRKIDPLILKRFFKCMDYDVESTKKLIEKHYDIRNRNPNIFLERDPLDEQVEGFFNRFDLCILPGLTPEGYKILFYKANEFESHEVNTELECKIFHMLSDANLRMLDKSKPADCDDAEDYDYISVGIITIFDVEHIKFSHMLKQSLSVTRVHTKFCQEAYPLHLQTSHAIHCPSFLVTITKPFLNEKLINSMRFHNEGIESVADFVPQEMLPCEFGGKAGTFHELRRDAKKLLESQREYLMDENYWKNKTPPRAWSWW